MQTYTSPGGARNNNAPSSPYTPDSGGLERPRVGRPPLGREDIHTTLHKDIRYGLEALRKETGFPISSLLDLAVQFLQNSLDREVARTGLSLRLAFQRMIVSSVPPSPFEIGYAAPRESAPAPF